MNCFSELNYSKRTVDINTLWSLPEVTFVPRKPFVYVVTAKTVYTRVPKLFPTKDQKSNMTEGRRLKVNVAVLY